MQSQIPRWTHPDYGGNQRRRHVAFGAIPGSGLLRAGDPTMWYLHQRAPNQAEGPRPAGPFTAWKARTMHVKMLTSADRPRPILCRRAYAGAVWIQSGSVEVEERRLLQCGNGTAGLRATACVSRRVLVNQAGARSMPMSRRYQRWRRSSWDSEPEARRNLWVWPLKPCSRTNASWRV